MPYWICYEDVETHKMRILRWEIFHEWAAEIVKCFRAVRDTVLTPAEPEFDENGLLIAVYFTGGESGVRRKVTWGAPVEEIEFFHASESDL